MTRKAAYIGFSYLTGLLLASFLALWLSFAAGSLFLCLGVSVPLILRPDRKSVLHRLSVCFAACAAGLLIYSGYDFFICEKITGDSGKLLSADAVICRADIYSESSAFYIAECELPCKIKGRVGFFSDNAELVRGDSVTLSGTLRTPDSSGFFDGKSYYRSENVFLTLNDPVISDIRVKKNNIFALLRKFRENTAARIRSLVPSDEGELMIGMLFGSGYWNMSESVENLMYNSGTGHIAAVSGMHMSIAAGIVSAAAYFAPKKLRFLLICVCCTLFALTADMTASVMRSLIMIIMVYGAELFGRKSDPLSSLGLAVIALTVFSPFTARSASFMLSVSGVLGTAVLAPYITERLEAAGGKSSGSERGRRLNPAAAAFIAPVCACAAVFPASALFFDRISVISPITNLIISPLCSAAAGTAMLGAVFSLLPPCALCGGFFAVSGAVCRVILAAVCFFGKLSFASIPAGLDIIPPLTAVVLLASAAGGLAGGDGFYAAFVCIFSVFVSVCAAAFYSSVSVSCPEAAVLTEGKGCVIVLSDGSSSQIYDMCGSKRGARAAYSYIARTGKKAPAFILAAARPELTAQIYGEIFPDTPIICADEKIGLTYSPENNIIKFGDTCVYYGKDHFTAEKAGARIICVNGSCSPPDEKYSLCVYNCTSAVSVDAEAYICARDGFSGSIPAGAYYGGVGCGEFIISGGGVSPKEEVAWLR
ncbi:MAG: ComEC family competence protein [Ruminococcus sp.]|nr:ComEC family competence protein [Ruminococcus sp.]